MDKKLSGDQLESCCLLVETRRIDREQEISVVIDDLCSNELADYICREQLLPAYQKWKRKQRLIEDHGDDTGAATDPDELEAPAAAPPEDGGDVVKEVIGKLLTYMGQSMLREKYVWKKSEVRLRAGESIERITGPGEITLPDGKRVEWLISALLIQRGGVTVRALAECRWRARHSRGGHVTIHFQRLTCKASEANMKALASSVGALQYLYFGERQFPGHKMTSARRLAAALGITVANLSHHMRNMAGKAMAPGGQARFAPLRSQETLVVDRLRDCA